MNRNFYLMSVAAALFIATGLQAADQPITRQELAENYVTKKEYWAKHLSLRDEINKLSSLRLDIGTLRARIEELSKKMDVQIESLSAKINTLMGSE